LRGQIVGRQMLENYLLAYFVGRQKAEITCAGILSGDKTSTTADFLFC